LLQLSQRFAAREFEPFVLGGACRHAREFTGGRPAELAAREGTLDVGQAFERFGYAQLVQRRARFVAEHALDVFAEDAIAEVHVHRRALRGQQPAPFSSALMGSSLPC
jgi:hypothetical protein